MQSELARGDQSYRNVTLNLEGDIFQEGTHASYSYTEVVGGTVSMLTSLFLTNYVARRFEELDDHTLNEMAESFRFENCLVRTSLAELLKESSNA